MSIRVMYSIMNKGLYNLLNFIAYIIEESHSTIEIGSNIKINGIIYLRNRGTIIVKDGLTINSGKNKNVIGGDIRTNIVVNKNSILSIGNNVGMSNTSIIANNKIIIEDNVMIGGGTRIFDSDFHPIDYLSRINNLNDIKTGPITIKEGVFIGTSCIILKDVCIGKHSIIGAGSIVTKNIPDYEIWAGNPAKFIRKVDK